MALIPEDPTKRNAAVAVVVSLAVVGLLYQYVWTPAQADLQAQQTRLEDLERANRAAELMYARGGANLEEQLALYERHVMQLEQLIPQGEEVPALINTITSESRAVNVELASIEPEGEEPGQFYTRTSYRMQAIGEYHDIGRFLTSIASLPRIITPTDLDLANYDRSDLYGNRGWEAPVRATFRIQTYILPEEQEGPPPAEVGGGEGGA